MLINIEGYLYYRYGRKSPYIFPYQNQVEYFYNIQNDIHEYCAQANESRP